MNKPHPISNHPITRDEQGAWDSYFKARYRYENALAKYGNLNTPEAKAKLAMEKETFDRLLAVFTPPGHTDPEAS